MKVLFDTNVIVDVFQRNAFCLHSFAAYDVCLLRNYEPYLAASTLPDLAFLFRRRLPSATMTSHEMLGSVLELFRILDVAEADCRAAYRSSMPDFEDALIAFAAQRCGVDLIVTRNLEDFAASPVPCMTPQAFVETCKPHGVSYEDITLSEA